MRPPNLPIPTRPNPNSKTLKSPFSTTSSSPTITHLRQTHAHLITTGQILNTLTAGKLLSDVITASPSHLPYAHAIFTHIQPPLNTFIYNSIIRAYAPSPTPSTSLLLYRQMLANSYTPNNYTYPFVLKAAARHTNPHIGPSLHATIIKRGFEDRDPFIQTSLISLYASLGSIDSARHLFDRCHHIDAASWNALIKGYIGCCRHADAIELFRVMQEKGVRGDEVTMLGVVSACAHLGAIDMGRRIHEYIGRNRMRLSLNLGTVLIHMYARCGEIETARLLFREMQERDVRTWSVMISGFAVNGFAVEALELFSEMQAEGFSPDSVSITGVLGACSHAGLVEEGMRILDRMAVDYLVEPTIEHYGCVVDLLGRAGRLEEALSLIKRIPLKPDVVLWGSLLVACRVHKKVEMGEMVAKEMLELDPGHAGALVFMSNVYAAAGKWELVEEVRNSMREQRIYKPPGSSSIELDGIVHEFLSGDNSHPQSDQIYSKLDEIGKLLSLKGHKPLSGGIMFNIDDEDKEVCLSQHSEKLAVAFGLINTKRGETIRIVKNLRICEDCHSVMKLVSEVFDRVVIVRDRKRFHHFKEGSCSCRDYW